MHRRVVKGIVVGAVVVAAVLLAALVAVSVAIGSGVKHASEAAVAEYGGDRVAALLLVVDSPAHSMNERNRAVWALGQLGDRRALPVLERHLTGQPCDHSRFLCQYELSKAIRLCRGGTNASAVIWRR